MRHIHQIRILEVIHEVLADESEEIGHHSLLFLAPETRNGLTPLFQLLDVPQVGQSHQCDEHIQEQPVLIPRIQLLQRFQPVAIRHAGNAVSCRLIDAPSFHECLLNGLRGGLLHVDALCPAADGLQQLLRLLAHHQEHRLLWRFLDDLQ